MNIQNPCITERSHCMNCHDHFINLRPNIAEAVISNEFQKDIKDEETVNTIIRDILDCQHIGFHELHKFEEDINGFFIFRAKKDNIHYLYCIDKTRIIFLRSFKNFKEYKKFINNKKGILRLINLHQ